MQGNRSRDTRPELAIRRALHREGRRYWVATRPLSGYPHTADLVFPRPRVAVFVDGCFWHGCPQHYTGPVATAAFWAAKVARNAARDRDVDEALRRLGWTPIRVWEHEPHELALGRIRAALESARQPPPAAATVKRDA